MGRVTPVNEKVKEGVWLANDVLIKAFLWLLENSFRGTWVVQLAEFLPLGLGAGLDLVVMGWNPKPGSTFSTESA